jgi:hypothetical protein
MGFNVGNYVKDKAKSAGDRIIDRTVNQVTQGKKGSVGSLVVSLTKSLFNIGNSYDSIKAISAVTTDNIVSRGSAEYSAMARKDPGRIAASRAVDKARLPGGDDAQYWRERNPTTKVGMKEEAAADAYDAIM